MPRAHATPPLAPATNMRNHHLPMIMIGMPGPHNHTYQLRRLCAFEALLRQLSAPPPPNSPMSAEGGQHCSAGAVCRLLPSRPQPPQHQSWHHPTRSHLHTQPHKLWAARGLHLPPPCTVHTHIVYAVQSLYNCRPAHLAAPPVNAHSSACPALTPPPPRSTSQGSIFWRPGLQVLSAPCSAYSP